MSETPTKGLVLTLGGAPAGVPHAVDGIPGLFADTPPTPVGPGCPITIERAQEISDDQGIPLLLVDLADTDAASAAQSAAVKAARKAVKTDRQTVRKGDEIDNLTRHTDALEGAES